VLTLRFHSPSELTLGPSRSFIVEGTVIRQAPDNEIVCERRDRLWHLEDEGAPGFECTDRSLVQFEDRQGRTSPHYGPFARLHFHEQHVFADGEPFAEFLWEHHQWKHSATGIRWRILNVMAAREA
jgi:hypothetical protein